MSVLQWLGIWGMTGCASAKGKDWDKWTKGFNYVLEDLKGQHYFREFLKERGEDYEKHVKIFDLCVMCDELLNEGASENQAKMQKVLDEGKELLSMTYPDDLSGLQFAIDTKNKAIEDLSSIYEAFKAEKCKKN